jgi:hypothetical protein
VNFCAVALFWFMELQKHYPWHFIDLFMNKNNESQLKLNNKLNWKITLATPNDPMLVMWNMLRSLRPTPLLLCEIKLIYFYKCVHSH